MPDNFTLEKYVIDIIKSQCSANQVQLKMVSITKDELWQIVQYIKFVREMG